MWNAITRYIFSLKYTYLTERERERDFIKNLLDFKHWNVPYITQHDFVPRIHFIDIESYIDIGLHIIIHDSDAKMDGIIITIFASNYPQSLFFDRSSIYTTFQVYFKHDNISYAINILRRRASAIIIDKIYQRQRTKFISFKSYKYM